MRFSVLHCVAVYGKVLQCVAVRRSVLKCVAVCCSVLQCIEFMPVRDVLCLILNESYSQCVVVCCSALLCVAVFCTHASVAVCFPPCPAFVFPAAQLCSKLSKKKSSKHKKTYPKIVTITWAKILFDSPPYSRLGVLLIQNPNVKRKQRRLQSFLFGPIEFQTASAKYAKEAYCLFWPHFFRLAKKDWKHPDVCDVGHKFESLTMCDSHICHKSPDWSQILSDWYNCFQKPLFFRHLYRTYI